VTVARGESRKLADDAPIAFAGEPLRVTRIFRQPRSRRQRSGAFLLSGPEAAGQREIGQ
jgi:hypothetical protein